MNQRTSRRRGTIGSTLVELIAVVAVIVILAGIVIHRSGRTSEAAKNAAVLGLLKDCRTAYAQMYFGSETNHYAQISVANLNEFVAGTRFSTVQVSRNGAVMTITSIPKGTFKISELTAIRIDCAANLYNWDVGNEFKTELEFRQGCLW
jgi:type II secretory pathway pseudopilin PulG